MRDMLRNLMFARRSLSDVSVLRKSPVGAVIGVVVLCLYVGYQIVERRRDAENLRVETLENAIPPVSVTHAYPGPASEFLTLPGNIEAWFQAPIYAQVSGYVKMWHKDYGAKVKKGDILAEINAPMLDAQFHQAKADLDSQRAKYDLAVVTANRYLALRGSHAVSEQSISIEVANMKSEAAKVAAAEQNLKNFEAREAFKTIIAPYDGVVVARNINVGDYINKEGNISDRTAVTNLFSVADIHKMRLFISVPEAFGHILKPGLTAEVTVPQFMQRKFTAEFLTVANGYDPNTRTAVTEFTIENKDGALWPGSYATVKVKVPLDEQHILVIPSSALVFQENGTQVAIVTDDNRIHFKSISIGKIMDAAIEVTDGLKKEDRIVNNPSAALLEGDEVRIVEPAPGYSGSKFDVSASEGDHSPAH